MESSMQQELEKELVFFPHTPHVKKKVKKQKPQWRFNFKVNPEHYRYYFIGFSIATIWIALSWITIAQPRPTMIKLPTINTVAKVQAQPIEPVVEQQLPTVVKISEDSKELTKNTKEQLAYIKMYDTSKWIDLNGANEKAINDAYKNLKTN